MISPSYYYSPVEERSAGSALGLGTGQYGSPKEGIAARVFLDVPYRGNGGDRHKLDLYLPNKRGFPVVVFAHGGAWVSGDKALHADLGTFLAKHGIGAVLVNYRLAPHVCHPAPTQDLARAFAWTCKHIGSYGGDPNRLFLCGHSAGGHSVSLLGTDENFLAAEGLGFEHVRGVISVSGVYKIHWNITLARLGFVFQNADRRAASPFWNVKTGCPTFLVLHASKELWTLSSQAYQFHKKLLRHNCASSLVAAPGEDHHSIIRTGSLFPSIHAIAIVNFILEGRVRSC